MTDDRFSEELDVNNFAILQSTSFYNSLIDADAFCINTGPNSGESIEEYRARFEKNLKEWRSDFPKGIIVALYGMGADGHTGGMIPGLLDQKGFDAEFNSDDRLVGTFDAESAGHADKHEFPVRISTTLSFMRNHVDHAAFYVAGESKRAALAKATQGEGEYHVNPAKIMTEMKDAIVFTDIEL
jgi:6-phosphogluconolactonase/glucosamine-6-phosphate isomerase/deaminase